MTLPTSLCELTTDVRAFRQLHRQSGWAFVALLLMANVLSPLTAAAELKTWDGKHSIERIEVTAVYFVPKDRSPLPDWKDRVSYFCRRIERFHEREFQGQSTLKTVIRPEPFRSERDTKELREGNGDAIFFRTFREVDAALNFGQGERTAYPILLVLSDINWRPLDDFFRVKPTDDGKFAKSRNSLCCRVASRAIRRNDSVATRRGCTEDSNELEGRLLFFPDRRKSDVVTNASHRKSFAKTARHP